MNARAMLIVASAIALAAAGNAQPTPARLQQPQQQDAPRVVLASADNAQTQSPASNQQQAPKRPHGRVTTCRCGDEQAADDDSQQ